MARTNGRGWQLAGKVELIYALTAAVFGVLGAGGISMAAIANVSLWVIAPLAFVACFGSAILSALALWKVFDQRLGEALQDIDEVIQGYDKRMERQREGFGQLWKFAHERGLFEKVEKDKEAAQHLQQLREDFYEVAPAPTGGKRRISETPRFLRSTRRRRR